LRADLDFSIRQRFARELRLSRQQEGRACDLAGLPIDSALVYKIQPLWHPAAECFLHLVAFSNQPKLQARRLADELDGARGVFDAG
jgi:hypothetical protein